MDGANWVGRTVGRFSLLEQIGHGGMTTVYRALDLESRRTVAVKILSPYIAVDATFKARFEREIQLLQDLTHPHIVPILEHGQVDDVPYIVMPCYDRGTLADWMDRGDATPQFGARVMSQVSAALEFAHEHGVIHRDVKPSNILIDKRGNACLADFGFAHLRDTSLSLTGSTLIGTPAYMSPEQCKGEEVDARSDQYSLGVLLFRMTTGRLPFVADTPMAMVLKHLNEPLPRPRSINPDIPAPVEAVLIKALAKDPAHRFASIADFNEAFQVALVESLDPSGAPRMRPVPLLDATREWQAAARAAERAGDGDTGRRKRRWAWLMALLLALAIPVSAWALAQEGGLASGRAAAMGGVPATPTNLILTIRALASENAPGTGTPISPGQIETAVAGTLTALGIAPPSGPHQSQTPELRAPATATKFAISGAGDRTPSPTSTRTRTPTSTRSAGSTATRTSTPNPSTSVTPTTTSTASPSPVPTQANLLPGTPDASPTLTSTPLPSPTRTPTAQPTPTYTATPQPPADLCMGIGLQGSTVQDRKLYWTLTNYSARPITITAIYLGWPDSNQELRKVKFAGDTIWDQKDKDPPTQIQGGWTDGVRTLQEGSTDRFRFEFKKNAASSGYTLRVTFDNGCQANGAR